MKEKILTIIEGSLNPCLWSPTTGYLDIEKMETGLNALIREELINFCKWDEPEIDYPPIEATVDEYLKSQQ
jgi:hypothetical protein